MPAESDATRTRNSDPATGTFDPALDAGLEAAFGRDPTPGGWSWPPLLRDDPSDHGPVVYTSSSEMPRGTSERYQLLGEIARGGMGVILKGRDPDLGRDLAFKVLKAELAGKPAAEQRFVEEAQVGGQLQHPGVVPVYDLGRFADGRPYFAMKLVKGRTLAEMLTDRTDPSAERGKFLQVFLQVCQTAAYAHAKGVIHRDLKPSNIMVGAFGEVLLMDWGLAKVLARGGVADENRATANGRRHSPASEEPTVIQTARSGSGSETAAGSVMGTPAFMSPEQACGEIDRLDERADVFGLGAVLCVILTGQPPYAADTSEAVRLMAVRGQLTEAFARLETCGSEAELVALCKRCLATERDARPRHAGDVATAVATHLADVEGRAHRAEVARAAAEARTAEEANTRRVAEQRAAEERKRRRVQLALAACVGLLLLGGGTFAWYSDRQATARRGQMTRNADALAELVGACEKTLRMADTDRATSALSEIDRRLPEGGGEDVRERVARCRADLGLLQELDAINVFCWTPIENRLPEPKAELARWRTTLNRYGVWPTDRPIEEACRLLRESLIREQLLAALDVALVLDPSTELQALLHGADPDPYRDAVREAIASKKREQITELARRPEALAQPSRFAAVFGRLDTVPVERRRVVLQMALRPRPSDLALLMALSMQYPIDQRESAETRARWLQAAVAAHPLSAVAHTNLGLALHDMGDFDGAAAEHAEAIRLDPRFAPAHNNLGNAQIRKNDLAGAIAAYREAIRIDPTFAIVHYNLAIALANRKDLNGAIAEYRKTIRLDPNYASAHINLSAVLLDQKAYDGALAEAREAIRLDSTNAGGFNNLSNALRELKQLDEAIAAAREAVRLAPTTGLPHSTLGVALSVKGNLDESLAEFREAIRLDPRKAMFHSDYSVALSRMREFDAAITELREAIRLDPEYHEAHSNLGNCLHAKKDYDGAMAAFREALRLSPNDALIHNNLGSLLHDRKDLEGEMAEYRKALELDPRYAPAHSNLGNVYRDRKEFNRAIDEFKQAIQLDSTLAAPHNGLGNVFYDKREFDNAIAEYRKAIALEPKFSLAYINLGNSLKNKNELKGAIAAYENATRADSRSFEAHYLLGTTRLLVNDPRGAAAALTDAIEIDPTNSEAHHNLGVALFQTGRLDRAMAALKKSIELNPDCVLAHMNLAIGYVRKQDFYSASAAFREAVRLDPKNANAHHYLGQMEQTLGDLDAAMASFRESIRLDQKSAIPHGSLARLLASGPDRLRDARKAVEHATQACQLSDWNDPFFLSILAAAHAEAGDFARAVEFQKKAMSFPAFERVAGMDARRRLELYDNKQPYHEEFSAVAPPPRKM